MSTQLSRRGFLGALAALAAATQVPVALKAEADSILVALLKAKSEEGYLFLVRKADYKQL